MRIHTELTREDIVRCVPADVYLELSAHGSRTHARAFDVALSTDTGVHRPGFGRKLAGEYAATWDQWGQFFSSVFNLDPNAMCGNKKNPIYVNKDDFEYKTDDRFENGKVLGQYCPNHKWEFVGVLLSNTCRKCGAVRRWRI